MMPARWFARLYGASLCVLNTPETSMVTLRALEGEPLADRAVRDTVLATARAIAERTGIDLIDLSATSTSITATLRSSRIEAVGFAAELRRLTNAWHVKKYDGRTLWGVSPREDDDEAEAWKDA